MENEIFKECDSRMRKDKDILIKFAKSKGYSTFSKYVLEFLEEKTAKELQSQLKEFGVLPVPSLTRIWFTNTNIKRRLEDGFPKKTEGKKCVRCGKVRPDYNHRFCDKCKADNFRWATNYDTEVYGAGFV